MKSWVSKRTTNQPEERRHSPLIFPHFLCILPSLPTSHSCSPLHPQEALSIRLGFNPFSFWKGDSRFDHRSWQDILHLDSKGAELEALEKILVNKYFFLWRRHWSTNQNIYWIFWKLTYFKQVTRGSISMIFLGERQNSVCLMINLLLLGSLHLSI